MRISQRLLLGTTGPGYCETYRLCHWNVHRDRRSFTISLVTFVLVFGCFRIVFYDTVGVHSASESF